MQCPPSPIRSAPAADVEDSQQKCSNLMEWGGQAKSVPARGAGAVGECSTGRPERYEHAWRYEERRDVGPMPRQHCKNTLIIIRGSPATYEARCPGDVSHGAKEDVEDARRRRPKQQANENKHHPHKGRASPPASARRPSRGCAGRRTRRTNSRPFASAASS